MNKKILLSFLILFVVSSSFLIIRAQEETNCPNDLDCDGVTDADELSFGTDIYNSNSYPTLAQRVNKGVVDALNIVWVRAVAIFFLLFAIFWIGMEMSLREHVTSEGVRAGLALLFAMAGLFGSLVNPAVMGVWDWLFQWGLPIVAVIFIIFVIATVIFAGGSMFFKGGQAVAGAGKGFGKELGFFKNAEELGEKAEEQSRRAQVASRVQVGTVRNLTRYFKKELHHIHGLLLDKKTPEAYQHIIGLVKREQNAMNALKVRALQILQEILLVTGFQKREINDLKALLPGIRRAAGPQAEAEINEIYAVEKNVAKFEQTAQRLEAEVLEDIGALGEQIIAAEKEAEDKNYLNAIRVLDGSAQILQRLQTVLVATVRDLDATRVEHRLAKQKLFELLREYQRAQGGGRQRRRNP